MVIADSTPKRIHISQVKENIDLTQEEIIFKRFPGQTAEEIAYYAPKPLADAKPEQVIIIAGTNDLTKALYNGGVIDEYEIVENIMRIGRAARESGTKQIHISGILVRKGYHYRNGISRVNNLLETRCNDEHFIFMDQSDITGDHISSDGIHPNFYGSTLLKMNILSTFFTFNPFLSDFIEEYDTALF